MCVCVAKWKFRLEKDGGGEGGGGGCDDVEWLDDDGALVGRRATDDLINRLYFEEKMVDSWPYHTLCNRPDWGVLEVTVTVCWGCW